MEVQTAALATGRSSPTPTAVNEQYNGTSWTEVGDLNTGTDRGRAAAAATSYTASIVFGGVNNPGDSTQAITESWNGSALGQKLMIYTAEDIRYGRFWNIRHAAFCLVDNRTNESNCSL